VLSKAGEFYKLNQLTIKEMKKITFAVMAIFLSLTFYPGQLSAATTKEITPASVVITNPADAAKVKTLELRLTEIKDMDKSDLKAAEKRELRKEVRSIKKQISELGGGVYISVGAIIIILLLLIILL
jgi:ferredoxin-fold anticodon binding domain-containing protein